MDIAEGFFIPDHGMRLNVPHGAQYLFVGMPDSYFADNNSPDPSTLGVTVTAAPEPAALAMLPGLLGLVVVRRIRRKGEAIC